MNADFADKKGLLRRSAPRNDICKLESYHLRTILAGFAQGVARVYD
jgi:hypothetical protein